MNTPVPEISVPFHQAALDQSSDILRALTHPLRLRLLSYIAESGSAAVQSMYQDLGIEQSLTSQHLRVLRRAGLVTTERDGKFVVYRTDSERLTRVSRALLTFTVESGDA